MSNMTYAQLVAKLQAFEEDNDLEFVASIDDIINLGEMKLWRDLDLSIFSATDSVATANGVATVTKPVANTELVAFKTIYYDVAAVRTWLQLRSYDWVIDHQTIGATGLPLYYAEQSETLWVLSPIPNGVMTLNARGITRPTRLSSSNTTTWLSQHMDDILFKACLAESEKFLKADDRAELWKTDYTDNLPQAKRETYELMANHYNLTPLQVPGQPTTQR